MFGLFGRKRYKPTVTPDDKAWVDSTMMWFIETFGFERLKAQPFYSPTLENFPYDDLNDPAQLQSLFQQICSLMQVDENEVEVKIFDDFISKKWTNWVPGGSFNEPGGTFEFLPVHHEKRYRIRLARSNLKMPQRAVAVMVHELSHLKLLGGGYQQPNQADLEYQTDLACIFWGFGVFLANAVHAIDFYWISRSGYLPNEVLSYANALVCYITGCDPRDYEAVLNANTINLFRMDYQYLKQTRDTVLDPEKIAACNDRFMIWSQIQQGFKNHDYDAVITACQIQLDADPRDKTALNNYGYALLSQEKYVEAIEKFSESISLDPCWDYPLNNRGFCKLMSGETEEGYWDIHSAVELNPQNALAWRNMGIYYLMQQDVIQAIHHLETAKSLDIRAEKIQHYLDLAREKMAEGQRLRTSRDQAAPGKSWKDAGQEQGG